MQDEDAVVEEIRNVATCDSDEKIASTLVLGLRDVIIPLEMDVDGDPLQDDEVRLASVGGVVERVLHASSEDVEPDREARLLYYRFRDVPYGAYRVSVRIAEEWTDVFHDLVVRKEGVFCGEMKLDGSKPKNQISAPLLPVEQEGEDAPERFEELRGFVDQIEPLEG